MNVDATVLAEEPEIGPHIQNMRFHIAEALHRNANRVGIKATTNEGPGSIGRREGIAARVVACVDIPEAPGA